MIEVRVLSSHIKQSTKKVSSQKSVRKDTIKAGNVYVTFELIISNGDEKIVLALSDCKFGDGVLKPPSRPGGWQRVFFPQVWFIEGIDNAVGRALYSKCESLAWEYNLPLAPFEECLYDWMPSKDVIKNFKNIEGPERIVTK